MDLTYIYAILLISYLITYSNSQIYDEYMKREHSLVKPYQSAGTIMPYWDYLGTTIITNNYIHLTGDVRSAKGAIWNKVPCYIQNWEMQINFKVYGKGKDLFGDGFAFWYVKEPMQEGDVFGSKDYFTGLAILADTYSNHNGRHNHVHPYISAMINNGTLHYDHDRDGTHTQIAGCSSKFRNVESDTYLLIRYQKGTLTVKTNIDNSDKFEPCFSIGGIELPTGYYFGFSAATGDLTDNHDIISLRLFDLSTPDDDLSQDRSNVNPSASFFEAPRDHVEDPKPSTLTSWKKILLIIFGVIAICGCVFIGGLFYSKQQEQKRKRFY